MNPPTDPLYEAAGAVQDFNHRSRTPTQEWTDPSDSYDAVGALSQLAERLEQSVEQAVLPAMDSYAHGRIHMSGGSSPDRGIDALTKDRDDAIRAARELATALRRMHVTLAPMGTSVPPEHG